MSGDREAPQNDLNTFYGDLDPNDPEGEWADEDEDGEYDYYLDADGIDDEDMDIEGEEDEEYPDAELGEEDEDMGQATAANDLNVLVPAGDNEEGGTTYVNLATLLNQTGGNADARTNLLQRLLAGPAAGTRGGAGLLRRLAGGGATQMSDEERMRAAEERRRRERWWTPQTEPHPRGVELLKSGEFGKVGDWRVPGRRVRPRFVQPRRRGFVSTAAQATIPNTNGTVVASYPSIPYVGQYAGEDYSVFYAATQYFTLHLYATNQAKAKPRQKPRRTGPGPRQNLDEDEDVELRGFTGGGRRTGMAQEDTSMKKIKNVQGVEGRWTVTDCDADRKGERMIYSSITPYVHMLYTTEDDTEHVELDFSGSRRRSEDIWGYDSFGIWSIRFSADGKEVVAGAGSGKIMVYDIEAQRRSLSVLGHADDVNAVCFADESSTNILVSGSDDGYVKVWDRRSLSSSTPSGVLVGATEGITYTSPKGDGRCIVVNSKDQAARLYDLRKMRSYSEFEGEPDAVSRYGQPRYDYRNARYPPPQRLAHPKDCSVMTFRGHSVLRTLIRCHFSPRESTGQSYIYSGSADGMIHIWSLDGRIVQVLNRAETVPIRNADGEYNDPSSPEPMRRTQRRGAEVYEQSGTNYTTRDVAWHGYEPTLMSTCWEVDGGYRRGGTIAKHEWKGLGKGGMNRLEDWVEKKQAENREEGISV